jgi:predicted DNA-binding protein YlxM (UPF0122 family)
MSDILLKREEALRLYETYGVFLTPREKHLYEDYFSYDLSLSEIAENEKISRSAVSDSLNKSLAKLSAYEKKLGLEARRQEALSLLKQAQAGDEAAFAKLEEIINHGI